MMHMRLSLIPNPKPLIPLLAAFCLFAQNALAMPLIRDAEIEHTLRQYADPIFRIGGLNPSSVRLFIVNDDALNAFVAGGANMFIHTGLIMSCETPDMLLGVMAHETGHIVGGHLAQGSEKLRNAALGSILTFVLGAAAGIAAGKPEAAAAVITGGQNVVGRSFLAFTRAHEESADQSALAALDKLNISASGMLKMFEMLRRHERAHAGSRDPYLLTHPLTTSRIEHVRDHVEHSSIPKGRYPKHFDQMHERMIAKLYGFIKTPEQTLQHYPISNKSIGARLARAVAYYKMPDTPRAIAEMDSLIAGSPKDPFFHELKGQILFETNHPKEALKSYQEAVRLLPDSALILSDLARVEMAQNDPSLIPSAVKHLEKSTALDDTNAGTWHQLAGAYGRAGNTGMASLALAEEAMLRDDPLRALKNLEQALPLLKEGSPSRQRAQDIKAHALEMQRKKKESESPF